MMSFINHFLVLSIFLSSFIMNGQTETVQDLLSKAQKTIQNAKQYSCNIEYTLYPAYKAKIPTEEYKGKMVKNNEDYYTKISTTSFINNADVAIKVVEQQKIIELQSIKEATTNGQSPMALLNLFITKFKTQTIEDKGPQWLCTLTSDVITQIPYGKVEIYINKIDYLITKQVLYFLVQMPYKDREGKEMIGNPKLEIRLSDYKGHISNQEKRLTQVTNYLNKNGVTYSPLTQYKDFKILKN